MIETKDVLLKGKSTLIKNKQYLSTAAYVEPFFDRMDPLKPEYVIYVKKADQISGTEQDPDLIFNRVHIQAILPETYYNDNGCRKCVGFIYGLDIKTPVAKFYIADIDEDGNLFSFDLSNLIVQEIEDATPINYSPIQTLLERTDNNSTMIKQMQSVTYADHEDMIHKMGEWVDYTLNKSYTNEGGKIKLSTSLPIDAYKSLKLDKDSYYFVDATKAMTIDKVFKAFASIIKNDKDIINNFEKTILLARMLGL